MPGCHQLGCRFRNVPADLHKRVRTRVGRSRTDEGGRVYRAVATGEVHIMCAVDDGDTKMLHARLRTQFSHNINYRVAHAPARAQISDNGVGPQCAARR